ncbi:MAG: hypothetical protein IPM11_11340 [Micropruina sp.]|nr:hypothetical protein [Micropruina sp.]
MSWLRSLDDQSDRVVDLHVAARNEAESPYAADLRALVAQHPSVTLITYYSDDGEALTAELVARRLGEARREASIYMCGPRPMMKAFESGLSDLGCRVATSPGKTSTSVEPHSEGDVSTSCGWPSGSEISRAGPGRCRRLSRSGWSAVGQRRRAACRPHRPRPFRRSRGRRTSQATGVRGGSRSVPRPKSYRRATRGTAARRGDWWWRGR